MSADPKNASRDYQRGYRAGKRRGELDAQRSGDQAFLDAVFLAALPAFIEAPPWTQGEKKLNSLDDRVKLAWDAASKALKTRRNS